MYSNAECCHMEHVLVYLELLILLLLLLLLLECVAHILDHHDHHCLCQKTQDDQLMRRGKGKE